MISRMLMMAANAASGSTPTTFNFVSENDPNSIYSINAVELGVVNGKKFFSQIGASSNNSIHVFWNGTYWFYNRPNGTTLYFNATDSALPPSGLWQPASDLPPGPWIIAQGFTTGTLTYQVIQTPPFVSPVYVCVTGNSGYNNPSFNGQYYGYVGSNEWVHIGVSWQTIGSNSGIATFYDFSTPAYQSTTGLTGFYETLDINYYGTPAPTVTLGACGNQTAPTVTQNLTIMPKNVLAIYNSGPPPSISYFTRPFVIYGTGFNPIAEQNSLTFNKNAFGIVTAATSTELTVEFPLTSPFHTMFYPTSDGALTVSVESFGATSNTATIATVIGNAIRFLLDENNPLNFYNENLFFDPLAGPELFTFGGELDPVKIIRPNISFSNGSGSFEVHKPGILNVNVLSLIGYGNGYFVIYYYKHISGYTYETPIIIYSHTGPYGNNWNASSSNSLTVATNDVVVVHWNFDEIGTTSLQEIMINTYFND